MIRCVCLLTAAGREGVGRFFSIRPFLSTTQKTREQRTSTSYSIAKRLLNTTKTTTQRLRRHRDEMLLPVMATCSSLLGWALQIVLKLYVCIYNMRTENVQISPRGTTTWLVQNTCGDHTFTNPPSPSIRTVSSVSVGVVGVFGSILTETI